VGRIAAPQLVDDRREPEGLGGAADADGDGRWHRRSFGAARPPGKPASPDQHTVRRSVGAGGALSQGKFAPNLWATSPTHLYEAMLTGPQSMDTFSNGNITPQEKRDVIAYIESMKEQPGYGGFGLGGLGPVSEGLFAWVGGLGVMVAFAVWIAAHTTRTKKKKGTAE